MKNYWTSDEDLQAMRKMQDKFDDYLIFGNPDITEKRRKANEDNRKWAYIIVGNTRKLACVDNKTDQAYKVDGYNFTWEKWSSYKFDRWCSLMDL